MTALARLNPLLSSQLKLLSQAVWMGYQPLWTDFAACLTVLLMSCSSAGGVYLHEDD